MRFTKEKELRAAWLAGTIKYKTKFLWLPVTIDGETRWLEEATVGYSVNRQFSLLFGDSSNYYYYWAPYCFKNK